MNEIRAFSYLLSEPKQLHMEGLSPDRDRLFFKEFLFNAYMYT